MVRGKRIRVICGTLLLAATLHADPPGQEKPPKPPESLNVFGQTAITPEVYRGSMRYLDTLMEEVGPNVVLIFPGRSLTYMSIQAEQEGVSVVNIPGSGLTEALDPKNLQTKEARAKIALYRQLVTDDLARAAKAHPGKRFVIVDTAQSGNTLEYFQEMVRDIVKSDGRFKRVGDVKVHEVPSEKRASKKAVISLYVPTTDISAEGTKKMEAAGISPIKLSLPWSNGGKKLSSHQSQVYLDRFYFHQMEAHILAADAGNVPKFDPTNVNLNDPQSVEDYKTLYQNRDNQKNADLREHLEALRNTVTVSPEGDASWRSRPDTVPFPCQFGNESLARPAA